MVVVVLLATLCGAELSGPEVKVLEPTPIFYEKTGDVIFYRDDWSIITRYSPVRYDGIVKNMKRLISQLSVKESTVNETIKESLQI